MLEFLHGFLAEVLLSIALCSFLFSSMHQEGWKWKIFPLFLLAIMSPLYLRQKDFPSTVFILVWTILFLTGLFLLVKNVKMSAYALAVKTIQSEQQREPRSLSGLSEELKKIEDLLSVVLFTTLGLVLFIPLHRSVEVLQVPLQLGGVVILVIIGVLYFTADKSSLQKRMRIDLMSFFAANYVLITYAFLFLSLYLHTYFSMDLARSSIVSAMLLLALLPLSDRVLSKLKAPIICSEDKDSLGKTFSKLTMANTKISLLLALIFSDVPMVYLMFVQGDIDLMIWWTFPFISFVSSVYLGMLRSDSEFKMRVGLLEVRQPRKS